MRIELKKFGEALISRPAGREAYLVAKAYLLPKGKAEIDEIIIDFFGVDVLTPSWADEFLTPLQEAFPGKVRFEHTENSSVQATLETLAEFSPTRP